MKASRAPSVALLAAAANRGGAHVAAMRLYRGLRQAGCNAAYVTGLVAGDQPDIGPPSGRKREITWKMRARIGRGIARWFDSGADGMQSLNLLPSGIEPRLVAAGFNVVHLHWVNNEFIAVQDIGCITAPMVWTLHDMWAFCGTEHYLADPSAYLGPVGTRPSDGPSRLARWNWERKRRHWAGIRPTLVAPSRWIGELASRSRLLGHCRVEVVPYGLDLDRFSPTPITGPDSEAFKLVFGAAGGSSDPRKGFDLCVQAIQVLARTLPTSRFELITFGETEVPAFGLLPPNVQVQSAGVIESEEEMARLLATADAFIAPSRQDNLPNTVLEATACGLPSVAFRIGGMPDMIEHEVTGYLARPFDVDDLAKGLAWMLSDRTRLRSLKEAARHKAEHEFGSDRQADRMLAIYEDAMSGRC